MTNPFLADFANARQVTDENPYLEDPAGVLYWQAPEVRRFVMFRISVRLRSGDLMFLSVRLIMLSRLMCGL